MKYFSGDKDENVIQEHREQTKRIVYAIMYGAGAGKLADFLAIEIEQATIIINDFTCEFSLLM